MAFKIMVSVIDDEAFTGKDAKHKLKALLENGDYKLATIEVVPSDNSPETLISCGIRNLISNRQIDAFFKDSGYSMSVQELRREVLQLTEQLVNQIIIENEELLE